MKSRLALLLLAGVCASADAASKLIWQVSTDNGTTWQAGADIPVYSNTTFKVRCVVDWTGTSAYGFSGLTQTIYIDNYDPNDGGAMIAINGAGNRMVPFNFGAATLVARVSGATQRVIALGAGGAEGNIASGQQTPGNQTTPYSTANPAPIFTFDYVAGARADRTLVFRSQVATNSGVLQSFSYHASQTSSSTSFRESGTVQPASVTLVFDPACRITAEPADAALVPGGTASFVFGFTDPNAKYQWRKDGHPMTDDGRISGSQTQMLVIQGVGASDNADYDCVVTGSCFTTASRRATLNCKAVPIAQPKGGRFPAGRPIVLDGRPSQSQGVTYQWYRAGVIPLSDTDVYSGTDTGVLTINATDPSQGGVFRMFATNDCGVNASDSALITIYCSADFTADRVIDQNDFFAFLHAFGEGLPQSDINADGFLDFTDVDAFVQAYERGC